MELHERIAFVRKAAGLTQEQLGEKLGVTRQAVSKWESAQATPDALTVARLCTELGVSADFVLLGKEPDSSAASAPPPTVACPCCGKNTAQGTPKCQVCGYDFYPMPPDDEQRFAVLLLSCGESSAVVPTMMRFTDWDKAQCEQHIQSLLGTHDVRKSQILLRRGLPRSAALHIASCLEIGGTTRIVKDSADGALSDEELSMQASAMPAPAPANRESGIGFWGVVGAVVLGIVIASFL